MLKKLLFILAVLIVPINLLSKTFSDMHAISGEYAVYDDSRKNRFISFLSIDPNINKMLIYSRSYKEDKSIRFKVHYDYKTKTFTTIDNIFINNQPSEKDNKDVIELSEYVLTLINLRILSPNTIIDHYKDNNNSFELSSWIPFPSFRTIYISNSTVDLINFGKIHNETDFRAFVNFNGKPKEIIPPRSLYLNNSNSTVVDLLYLTVKIDSNWKKSEFQNNAYIIAIHTKRDAHIVAEQFELKNNDNIDTLFKKLLYFPNGYKDPNSIKLIRKDKLYLLQYDVYDNTIQATTECIHVVKKINNDKYIMLSFNAFKYIYNTNESYFNDIINSIIFK